MVSQPVLAFSSSVILLFVHLKLVRAVDCSYTDLCKAIDRVHIHRLIYKLVIIFIGHPSILWLQCYLTGRTQFVTLGNVL